jgi:hypothetical protein
MERITTNLKLGKVREATLNGRSYLVAPASLIVPGILNGSKGALLYPPEEVRNNYTSWNHTPLVAYHPTLNGEHVSARDPDILDKQGIGVFLKANIAGTNGSTGKLVGECWFDVEATKRVDNRIYKNLIAGIPIELSTGLFTDNERAPLNANWKGKPYDYIARNYRPDHVAILPDQVGACSINDGCGVMVNKKSANEHVSEYFSDPECPT